MAEKHPIVVCVDGSDIAKNAFEWYLNMYYKPNHAVMLCHVPQYWGDEKMMSPARIREMMDETKVETDALKEKFTAIGNTHGVEVHFEVVRGKEAPHEICGYAERIHAKAIVIGTRGLGKIKKAVLGSVSDTVLKHCHIPILIYKDK